MVRTSEAIKRFVMSFSNLERRKKNLEHYRQERRHFQNMEKDELDLEHINMRTEYEHRKNIMFLFLLSIVLSVLMDIWKFFFGFIESVVSYNAAPQASEIEAVQVVFVVFIILIVCISSITLLILISYTRRMRQINRSLLIIEHLKSR